MPPRTRLLAGLAVWALTRLALGLMLAAGAGGGDGVMALTAEWVQRMLAGQSPYDPVGVAYPPLAMALFVLPGLVTTGPGYALAFPMLVLAADVAGLVVAARVERGGRSWSVLGYALAVAAAGPVLLFWRYDLLPAVAHLVAAWLLLRGRVTGSWLALGVGIALKPYLAVVGPAWLVWTIRDRGWRGVGAPAAVAAAPSLVAVLAMLPLAGRDVALPYLFQLRRGLNVESLPAALVAELPGAEAVFSAGCLCWERTGPGASAVGLAASVAVLAIVALVSVAVWRRPTAPAAVAGSAAAVAALVLASPVFSPQYVVWLLPVAVLLADRRVLAASAGAALLAAAGYPALFTSLIVFDGTGRALVWGRAALLAAACWFAWPSKSASSDCPTSASPRSSTP